MKDDLISRQAAIEAILIATGNSSVRELYEHVQEHGLSDMWSGGVNAAIDIIIAVPSAQPEITDGQAIEHLQSTGWMQRHDKQMYEMGLKEKLADDSDSYDSLMPSAEPEPCEDCVSRKSVIRLLHSGYHSKSMIEEVKELPSAQPEQKWIPVSRDLPEPRWKDVFVTREYKGADDGNKDKRYVEVASMCGDEWVSYSDEYKIHPKNHKVIAWMELPKPYGGKPG